MARGPVTQYKVEWNTQRRTGVLKLIVWTGATTSQEFSIAVNNANDMQTLIDLVRNEKPVFYDSDTMTITTGYEAVGEAET